ncbi:hypothetical protein BGW80DRAFT_339574 [Lactifluus volemus]|nr:hypothetical protein BGW80DRAFT_339574 [Lactifluus volemus]
MKPQTCHTLSASHWFRDVVTFLSIDSVSFYFSPQEFGLTPTCITPRSVDFMTWRSTSLSRIYKMLNSRGSYFISHSWVLHWRRNTFMLHSHRLTWFCRRPSRRGADTKRRVAWLDCVCATPGAHPDATRVPLRDVEAQNTTTAPHYTSHRHMFHLNVARLLLGYGVAVNAWSNAGLWLRWVKCLALVRDNRPSFP